MVFYSGLNFLSTEEFRLSTSVATLAKFTIDISQVAQAHYESREQRYPT